MAASPDSIALLLRARTLRPDPDLVKLLDDLQRAHAAMAMCGHRHGVP
ncbi:MAG: hypothetical protein LC624_03460 [Halobacteriales archaeon]|nr:hypothetical protein [Halobacteriales archaeon]